jgi:ribosomal protein L13E
MPAGMSKAKGRRNSKSKKRPGFQAHPAKAGKRKVYKKNKPKVKSFSEGRGFIIASTNKYGYSRDLGFALNPEWKTGEPVWVPVS